MANKKPNAQHHLLPKNSTLVIRLTSAQKLYLRKLAQSENLSMSSYVLKQLGFDFLASSSLGLKNNLGTKKQ